MTYYLSSLSPHSKKVLLCNVRPRRYHRYYYDRRSNHPVALVLSLRSLTSVSLSLSATVSRHNNNHSTTSSRNVDETTMIIASPTLSLQSQKYESKQQPQQSALDHSSNPLRKQPYISMRSFHQTTMTPNKKGGGGGELADQCSHHIISSPYPDIPSGPHPPLFEFITKNWNIPTSNQNNNNNSNMISMNKIAIIDGATGLQRTFHDYYQISTQFAGALMDLYHVNETTTIAMFCPNHVDYVPVCLAIALCGAKMTPINPLYTRHELSTVLERSRTSILVTHISKLDVALQAMNNAPNVQHIIVINDNDDDITSPAYGTVTLSSIKKDDTVQRITSSIHELHKKTDSQPFCIPYSSGTTGLPKGVCLSHSNIISNLLQCHVVDRQSFLSHHTLISPLPFFHIYAYTVSMLYTAWQGQTLITSSQRFDLEQFCSFIEKYQPIRAHLVPPIILGLQKHPIVDKYDMSSLRMIMSAAAPLSSETELAVQQRFPNIRIKQGWGMSELSPIGTLSSDTNIRQGSVGPLTPSTFGKIIHHETGKSLGPHEVGELIIKGPQVMMGYLDDPDKTAECLSPSGWLRTGDIATYDEDGYIYITDRIKELIKVNGYPVAPAELEALLLTHPYVNDVAVIAIPDSDSGELPRAYIVLKDDIQKENDIDTITGEIHEWIKERVAPYKRIKGGIIYKDLIPKSASGKILRRILKDEYHKDLLLQSTK